MTNPFIPLSLDGECKQSELTVRLGPKELLSQLTEDCGELIQAAQKMRRVLAGTTKVSRDNRAKRTQGSSEAFFSASRVRSSSAHCSPK